MFHEPAASSGPDASADYKSRLGVLMFIVYGVIYAGFVLINVLLPNAMDYTVFWGLNVAVVYGFGLIIFALALAVVYSQMCSKREAECETAAPVSASAAAQSENK